MSEIQETTDRLSNDTHGDGIDEITILRNEITALRARLRDYESLTPGGSEFANDSQAVFAYIKDRLATLREYAIGNVRLRDEIDILRARAETAEAALATEREKHRWIPVSERLPEDFTTADGDAINFLTCDEWGQMAVVEFDGKNWKDSEGDILYFITHWQPLPEVE